MAPEIQNTEPSWPPRSPHEALLSTPGGRQRYREMMNRLSPTSSPSRQRTRAAASVYSQSGIMRDQIPEDEDEDEETLQLKLQEIQARLKLKRLQKAKEREAAGSRRTPDENLSSPPTAVASEPASRRFARMKTPEMEDRPRQSAHSLVQVPASPVRKPEAPLLPKSPSRVLLGIDKGLRAKDISLKRAPSFRRAVPASEPISSRAGTLNRAKSMNCISPPDEPEKPRMLSFNERLAAARAEETSRAMRQERAQRVRSNAFEIGKEEMEEYKKKAVDIPDEPLPSRSFTRDEIVGKPRSDSSSATLTSSQTAPSFRSVSGMSNTSDSTNNTSSDPKSSSVTVDSVGEQSTSFEPYSSFHLSKRILPHRVLARHVSGKKTFNIKDLLRTVKAPDFALPDIEQDLVVFAVVAKKSEPRSHKPSSVKSNQPQEDPRKYMVLNLVDLEYELDLFLFNSGFNRYWKLTEGTVVAILNPGVMPPPPGRQDTGRFSLVINSDEDTILEIGAARDLGFCQAIKKDGSLCSAWVNKRRTQYCEFHSNEAVRKQRSSRMEVNSQGFGGHARYKSHSQQSSVSKDPFEFGQSGGGGGGGGKKKADNYDWETKTQWFVSKTHSAADLIDGKDRSAADRRDKAEFLKRSLEAKEREREMMKKLGQIGHAAGKEYMQRSAAPATTNSGGKSNNNMSNSSSNSSNSSTARAPGAQTGQSHGLPFGDGVPADAADEPVRPGIASLFLDKEREIHLSPIKRKRTGSSNAGSISSIDQNGAKEAAATAAAGKPGPAGGLGWGSGLREKLSNMREGEKLKPEQPPLRKKTRFVTDKGIREAGRESLGNLADRQIMLGDDIDDELIIVN